MIVISFHLKALIENNVRLKNSELRKSVGIYNSFLSRKYVKIERLKLIQTRFLKYTAEIYWQNFKIM